MSQLYRYLNIQIGNNRVFDIVLALAVLCGVLFAAWMFKLILIGRLKRLSSQTRSSVDDRIVVILSDISATLYLAIGLYVSAQFVTLPEKIHGLLRGILFVVVVFESVKLLQHLLEYLIAHKIIKVGVTGEQRMALIIRPLIGVALWVVAVILILSNLGINVTSLLASLGISGIAVALASQRILGDIFSSFSIYIDQPFKVNDYIVTGPHQGTVKRIGLKSTRIEALEGEEIVIPNTELTNARVQNFKRMSKRRVEFTVPIKSSTDPVKMSDIPRMIQAIIEQIADVTFERVTFKNITGPRFEFEIVYYVKTGEYRKYMDVQQQINSDIVLAFKDSEIEFAG